MDSLWVDSGDEVDDADHEDAFDWTGEGGEVECPGVVFFPPKDKVSQSQTPRLYRRRCAGLTSRRRSLLQFRLVKLSSTMTG